MYVFKKARNPENRFDVSDIEFCIHHDADLPTLLEEFALFLRGCGYSFSGEIQIVDDNESESVDLQSGVYITPAAFHTAFANAWIATPGNSIAIRDALARELGLDTGGLL